MRYGYVRLAKPCDCTVLHPSKQFKTSSQATLVEGARPFYRTFLLRGMSYNVPHKPNANAAIPAFAIRTSSADFTPETPTAPRH